MYIPNLSKIIGPLYSKTTPTGQKYFNQQDIALVRKIKDICKNLPDLQLPLESEYIIVETDASQLGWGTILLAKPSKYDSKNKERICRYSSGKFKEKDTTMTSLDFEILGVVYAINKFRLFLHKPFTIRTDCEAIVRFHNKLNERKLSTRRWAKFLDCIVGQGYKVEFEHIKGSDNRLTDWLSMKIYLEKEDNQFNFCADNGEQQDHELWGIFSSHS